LPFNSEDSESNRLVKLNHIRIDVFTLKRAVAATLWRLPYVCARYMGRRRGV